MCEYEIRATRDYIQILNLCGMEETSDLLELVF